MELTNNQRTKLIVFGLMMGLLLSSLDQTVTATAMPTIISSMGGLALYSWVFSIYMLTTTASIPIFGKLADLYGRKRIYLIGMGFFILGSALCGLASSMMQLIIFRGIQGIGAGALMPLTMTIISDIFPPEKRGKMQGIIGAVFGISSVVGPAIGGFITEQLNWHWVFFVNLPFGILAAIILSFALKESKGTKKPTIDWAGAFILTSAVIGVLLITVLGSSEKSPNTYAWTSPQIMGLAIFSGLLIALFIWIETKAKEPIIPLYLFNNRTITVSSLIGFFSSVGMFGAITYIPLFAQGVIGVSPSIAGYILTPMMLSMVVSSTIGGFLLNRFSFKSIAIFSMAGMSLGLLLMSRIGVHASSLEIAAYMIILGLSLGPLMPLLTIAAQSTVGSDQRGVATSVVSFFRSIGGALGVSILGSVMSNYMSSGLMNMGNHLVNVSPDVLAKFNNAQSLLRPEMRSQIPPQLIEGIKSVFTQSIDKVFGFGSIFVLIGLGATLFMGKGRLKPGDENKEMLEGPLSK